MPNRILALDLQGSELVAVMVESSFRSYRFVAHHTEPRDPERSLPDQLRELLQRQGFIADTVLSSLPGSAVAYRIFDLPFRDRRKLQQTVPFELESQVPFALEDAIIDFQVISRTATGTRVFAALAPRDRVEQHLKMLSDAGLDPAIVDFAPLTTLNVLQLFDGERPGRYAFLHLTAGRGTLALYRDGSLDRLRVIDVAGEPLAAGLARDVVWTLRSFDGGPLGPTATEPLPLLVGGQSPPELAALVEKEMPIRVQRLEDLPLRNASEDVRTGQGAYAAAIGLALREIAEAPTLGVNFRREDFAYHKGEQELRSAVGRLAILASVVVVLFLASTWVSYHRLSRDFTALRRSVRMVFQATLPEEKVIQDETVQLTQAIDTLRKRLQQTGGAPISPLGVLREISTRAPNEPRMNVEELTFEPEVVRIRAKTVSFEAVEAVKRTIADSPLFKEVQVKDPRTIPDGSVEFRLNVQLKTDESPAEASP